MLILLGNHPGGAPGQPLADLIRSEASNRLRDGVIHGGFIVISWMLIVCFVYLSRGLGSGRVRVLGGLVAFCVGSAALMASMTLDGLVIPALAARVLSAGQPPDLAAAGTLLLFSGTAIKVLMPMGLLFQTLAMLCWSAALVGRGWRLAGGSGIAGGLSYMAAAWLLPGLGSQLLLAGIVLLCLWYLLIAALLWAGDGWP